MNLDPNIYPVYLRVEDLAQLFDISRSKAYSLVHSKDGPPTLYIGKRLCIPRDGLSDWIQEHTR